MSLKVPVFHALFQAKTEIKMMPDGCLYVNGRHVSVAYFHIGYSPSQFTRADWDRRELVERSNAVKVPSVPTHLAGTKKIQQVLSDPATLDRFLGRIQKKGGFVMSGNTRAVAKALFAKGDDEVGKQYADMLEQLPLSERLQRTMMTQVDPQQLVAEAKTKVNSPTPSLLPSPSHSASIQPHPSPSTPLSTS